MYYGQILPEIKHILYYLILSHLINLYIHDLAPSNKRYHDMSFLVPHVCALAVYFTCKMSIKVFVNTIVVVWVKLVYKDDQSEPLCICLATIILSYLTDS